MMDLDAAFNDLVLWQKDTRAIAVQHIYAESGNALKTQNILLARLLLVQMAQLQLKESQE